MTKIYLALIALLFGSQSTSTTQNNSKNLGLKVDTPIVLRATGKLSSDPGKPSTASLVAANDITVDDVIVIPKGSTALFNVARRDAKRFNRPGELELIVEGVYALDGQIVPVSERQHLIGDPPCVEGPDCVLLPLFFWSKGQRPFIPAGTLIGARVSQTTWFNRALVERIEKELSLRAAKGPAVVDAKVHLYSPSVQSTLGESTTISLDGKRLRELPVGQYACISLTPGPHVLAANNHELEIDAIAGRQYYVEILQGSRVMAQTGRMAQTEGYQVGVGRVEPAGRRTLKDQVPCF